MNPVISRMAVGIRASTPHLYVANSDWPYVRGHARLVLAMVTTMGRISKKPQVLRIGPVTGTAVCI